jgi:hypothetical protein
MKILILSLALLAVFCCNCYSAELTLKQAEDFFASIEQVEGYLSPEEKYFSPAVDIYALWQMAGIRPEPLSKGSNEYLFRYPIDKEDTWYLRYPETKLHATENLKVLQIGSSSAVATSDYQFLFFRKKGNDWVYFDNIYALHQKYGEPEIILLDETLFCMIGLVGSGTGVLLYDYNFYSIKDYKINSLFSLPQRGHVSGWGMVLDRSFHSNVDFKNNVLSIEYSIDIFISDMYYQDYGIEDSPEHTLFTAKRSIFFNYDGTTLTLDDLVSQITPDNVKGLFMEAEKGLYLIFKPEFDKLEYGNELERRWFKDFTQRIKNEINVE